MGRLLDAAKSELVVGFKHKEGFFHKMISEQAAGDLDDMQKVVDYLSHQLSEQKEKLEKKNNEIGRRRGGDSDLIAPGNTKEEEKRTKTLREEIRRLRNANEKLSSQRKTELSALLAERDFVWNQFKKMESDYTSLSKSRHVEVEQAKNHISELQQNMEKLQSSTKEKDDIIVKLKAELAKLEADLGTLTAEIAKLSKELEMLRSSEKASETPTVNHPRLKLLTPVVGPKLESSTGSLRSESNSRVQKVHQVKKQSSEMQASDTPKASEKICKRSSKRRGTEAISPRLFTSAFKIPKLKSSSPHLIG